MNRTAKQMLPAIGQTVLLRCESLQVACTVVDVKQSYGQTRLEVMPVAGTATTQWVAMGRISASPDRLEYQAGPCNPFREEAAISMLERVAEAIKR